MSIQENLDLISSKLSEILEGDGRTAELEELYYQVLNMQDTMGDSIELEPGTVTFELARLGDPRRLGELLIG